MVEVEEIAEKIEFIASSTFALSNLPTLTGVRQGREKALGLVALGLVGIYR